MKIQVVEANTNRPLANTKIQLQVKGQDSGFITLTTDSAGMMVLESKYEGQQLLALNSIVSSDMKNPHENWIIAKDGGKLAISMTGAMHKATEAHGNSTK